MLMLIAAIIAGGVAIFAFSAVSTLFIKASPFALAALIGLSAQRVNGWLVFLFWLVLLYSLMSYDKLRKAIIFVSSAFCSYFFLFFLIGIIKKMFPASPFVQAISYAIITLACVVLSLRMDENSEYICINLAAHFKMPMLVQQIIASVLYGFSAALIFNVALSETTLVKTQDDLWFVVLQWVFFFIVGGATFFFGYMNTAKQHSKSAEE